MATGGLSADGYGHSVTAMARTSSGSGRASPVIYGLGWTSPATGPVYMAAASPLGSVSRSAPSSALCSALRSSSLSSPPTPIYCEAASASEAATYTAAARIEPASTSRLTSPALLYDVAGRTLGRGCSDAQGMRVDQPASISSTSTAGQAPPQLPFPNYTEARAGRSNNETSDPASHSQARTVTLRYCDSFLRSSSTVMLCSHYRLSRLQPPLLCVRATTVVVVTRSCLRCNPQ